ncbi:hypothetical protein RirG_020930 [Rhizophagus irregularis DAOM 197198w]|uniref:Uncharacterized protein n=1 Tax=Rhizophagus irregularis (strain DAOM 197198w) TaxID=1432141 RepID=A0A015LYI1_RHIIW|nr:hypothetical protein RirG_020930 [Rhizophagus irregularis DAOM 197198w]
MFSTKFSLLFIGEPVKKVLSFILRMKANVNQETYRDFIRKIFLEMSHMRQWFKY